MRFISFSLVVALQALSVVADTHITRSSSKRVSPALEGATFGDAGFGR